MPTPFLHNEWDDAGYDTLLARMQRLRGKIYLEDGAIDSSELSADGRHQLADDESSWHLLILAEGAHVLGCMRYRTHQNAECLSGLGAYRSAIAQRDDWGPVLTTAVENELARARLEGLGFGEAGGWALARVLRFSREAVRMVLATYCLAQLLGEALVISTATVRNASADILRRIGGRSLAAGEVELPPYYDPRYKCEMELLRFDSRAPNPKYRGQMAELRSHLVAVPVIRAASQKEVP